MDPINEFRKEVAGNIKVLRKDRGVQDLSMSGFLEAQRKRYSYNFSWLGRPIIQYPGIHESSSAWTATTPSTMFSLLLTVAPDGYLRRTV